MSTRGDGRPGPLTREAVIAAAREMVASEGVGALSLRGLGRHLGVTAPALYAYVDDREDLLRAVAQEGLAQLGERFDAIETDDPVERVRQQCRGYVDFAVENPDLFVTMFTFPPELQVASPIGIETDEATMLFRRSMGAIDAAVEAGAIDAPEDSLVAALSIWASMHGLATVLTMGFGFDDETRSRIVEHTVGGVVASLGVTGDDRGTEHVDA